MNSRKRASLSSNSPLDQLFTPAHDRERDEPEQEQAAAPDRPAARREAEPRSRQAPLVQAPMPIAQETERELRQTTIMIYDDQADWLDEACYLARRESGSNVSKAAILRALVDMAREDEGVREQLRERLGI